MNRSFHARSPVVLFVLRLVFYFSVITLIFSHPGIAVSFDRISAIQWFIIIPVMTVIAYQSIFAAGLKNKFLLAAVVLIPLSIIAGGFSPDAFMPFIAGFAGFIFTFLLFHYQRLPFNPVWARIVHVEPFFLAWICLRLLSLSRSNEEIAGQSGALTQFILVWTLAVFLFHNIIIYLCFYPNSRVKSWKEGLAFFAGAAAAVIIFIFVLPADFVSNAIIENLVSDRIPQRITSGSEKGLPQRGNSRRTLPRNEGSQGELRGLSEHEWPGSGESAGESRQYLVKIVVSEAEPLYMGDSFRGLLDPVQGFLTSRQEPLNDLAGQRLFTSWFNNEYNFDTARVRREVFSLSMLRQKYFPWYPVSADPVILHENAGPLRYIHQVVSNIHLGDPLRLVSRQGRLFSDYERDRLAHYLEVTLDANDRIQFEAYLKNALDVWQENRGAIIENDRYLQSLFTGAGNIRRNVIMENIIALLTGFSAYQYNLANNEDHSIASLKKFLFDDMEGDCTEFSNTLALLGRLAGIPSRVVTGYLAAEDLQTPAHINGLIVLQRQIPFLQQFPFDNLFMVTNLHSHSWTQFYIPDYGWLDFEATSFAIPPVGMGDFNNWDVVIPILDGNKTISQVRKFPWQAAGRAAAALVLLALICAYSLRYGRELVLFFGSRGANRNGARCLYLLLLARLAADGQPIKPASKTAHEYSQLFKSSAKGQRGPELISCFENFADIYAQLRWRDFKDDENMSRKFSLLKQEYHNILNVTRKRGPHHFIKRIFSLRGLAYL